MAATDDKLQKLDRPPIYNGKEDEWNEWSLVMRSYLSLLSIHIAALVAEAEDPTNPDMSMSRIKTILTDGVAAAQKLFHVLVMNVRGPALTVIRGITEMNGALAWRALVKRFAPNTKPQIQSLMNEIINVRTFPSELTEYEIALDEWQKNIRKWETISGDLFNESMKKTIFLDKAPLSVRISFQIQSLDTFESMTAVTLQFLQRDAKYQAGVTALPDNKRKSDNMEINALTKRGKSHKGKGKNKAERQQSSCFGCGRVRHMIKNCWSKDTNKVNMTKDRWSKDKRKSGPYNKGRKREGKGKRKGKK